MALNIKCDYQEQIVIPEAQRELVAKEGTNADTEPEHWRNLHRQLGHYWESSALPPHRNAKETARLSPDKNTIGLK